jgi:hypothetical protein
MDEQLENRIRFLRAASTEKIGQTDCGLLDHLLGTRHLLVDWGAQTPVCNRPGARKTLRHARANSSLSDTN